MALGEKDWFMRGEVDAGRRPKNSALEVDLDFETTVKPPPQVCRDAQHLGIPEPAGACIPCTFHSPRALSWLASCAAHGGNDKDAG